MNFPSALATIPLMTNPPPIPPLDDDLRTLLRLAIREDLGTSPGHDRTVELSIPEDDRSSALVIARQPGVLAGGFLILPLLREYDPRLNCTLLTTDGSSLAAGQTIAKISGPTRGLLSAERVLLNFLGHLSGIATLTARYVAAVAPNVTRASGPPSSPPQSPRPLDPQTPPPPAICDTRKTTPGFRRLDKYAVRCGGGTNHRLGLYDGVMLKDNHLAALRQRLGTGLALRDLCQRIRQELPPTIPLWLEVDTLQQLAEALPQTPRPPDPQTPLHPGPDIILLDNFTLPQLQQAVTLRQERCAATGPLLEASGGITLENVRAVAETGVDRISIGALTHSAPVLDVALDME